MFPVPTNASNADYQQRVSEMIGILEGPARRNYVRNGDFQIAQLGTSFAGITTEQYTLDGWRAGVAGTNTVTQQSFTVGQTDVPNNPRNFIRVDRTVAAGAANTVLAHRIEHPDRLAGKTVTISFYAKVASGTKALVVDVISSGVTTAIDTSDTAISATTSWALIDVEIAIPTMTAVTADAYLEIRIREAASFGTFTLDVAEFQVEEGPNPTRFERLEYAEQLRWNQRFVAMSFKPGTAPAQNAGLGTGEILFTAGKAGAANQYATVRFPVRMRKSPTGAITTYNPAAASAEVRDADAAANCTATAVALATEDGFSISCTGNASTAVGNQLRFHFMARVEL